MLRQGRSALQSGTFALTTQMEMPNTTGRCLIDHNERLCWVCGKPIGKGDIVLSGLGTTFLNGVVLSIHRQDCVREFLLYLNAQTRRPVDVRRRA